MRKRSKIWLAAAGVLLGAFIISALFLPKSYGLAAFSDIAQCLFLISGLAAIVPLAIRAERRMRLFWSLIILGVSLWFIYQLFWTYYEVILRTDVPGLFVGDVVLFLHIVPFMAALAVRPHVPRDEYSARVGRLDFALLLLWWFYLYALLVLPWYYVVANLSAYNSHLNAVYVSEEIAFLVGLIACWILSKGEWKSLYANLFGMSLCYASSSTLANLAIAGKEYYSGSLYDIPIVMSMAWLTWIGLRTKAQQPAADTREVSTLYGVWLARCSMIAVFSLPVFAAWALSDNAVPARVRVFRLTLTLVAAFFMGVMVFLRQYLLDRELTQLLQHSRESFENLKRLHAQILQSEKLASIGQLVGGAAHELNNPITAMLGYSDMLLSTSLTAEQAPFAAKIGQYVRRTKSLVASLISFARQAPGPKTPVDLNTLARTAVKLTQSQWEALDIKVRTQFDPALPKVLGDSNQLLQVCLQLVASCLHLLSGRGGQTLTVSTEQQVGIAVVLITTSAGNSTSQVDDSRDYPVDSEDGLALSACEGILQEHHGRIASERGEDGAILLRVEIPVTESASVKSRESTGPVLWQSQPYA